LVDPPYRCVPREKRNASSIRPSVAASLATASLMLAPPRAIRIAGLTSPAGLAKRGFRLGFADAGDHRQ